MELSKDKTEELIEVLQGSCDSLEGGLEAITDGEIVNAAELTNELEVLQELDSRIFNCNQCGWWCCVSEIHEDESQGWICEDCGEE